MARDKLKVGIVTNHIPVKKISNSINSEKILNKILLLNDSLNSDFKINKPKIAVIGLNPHSGDNGLIGHEENQLIKPAINESKRQKIHTEGPFPADGFFFKWYYKNYDAVLAMYHDQGLIPFKIAK